MPGFAPRPMRPRGSPAPAGARAQAGFGGDDEAARVYPRDLRDPSQSCSVQTRFHRNARFPIIQRRRAADAWRFLAMKTYVAKPTDRERNWVLVDAEGKTLGRLATQLADILR